MRLKRFLLLLLIFIFSVSMIFAMGSSEQAKPESGIIEAQPSQDQRVVPGSKEDVYFSFSGITKKVLPSVVELISSPSCVYLSNTNCRVPPASSFPIAAIAKDL